MTKRITALLLALCLLISAAPVFAGAATGQQVSANAVTVTAGNTATVTLKAENFTAIAALDVYVYYDPTVLTVSSTANGSMLSGAQASVNTADAGTVKLSAMSLAGINGSGNLLTVYFSTASDCTPGTYPIEVAIGRAYDADLVAASIDGVNGSVTVNKPVVTERFSLYASMNTSTLQKADILSYSVRNNSSLSFVSADFTVEYDSKVFAFESLELDSALTGEGAVYSVNSNVPGQVRIAYANDNPVSSYYLFTVKLTVIADVDATTTVKAQSTNVYREDLSAYQPGSYSRTLTLQKQPEVMDYPNVFLQTEALEVGQQSKSTFFVEAGAGIAAADFTVTYDPAVLRCTAVTLVPDAEEKGGMVIINDTFAEGTVRFSYVNMDAYAGELALVEIIWEPISSPEAHYQTAISGVGVVDASQNPITLEYLVDSGCIFVPTVVPPTCLEDGYTDHTCGCGESYQTDSTDKLGHDIQYFEQREPTCTLVGWNAHEGCSRCDYGDYVEIPALGHEEISHEAKEPTCLEVGWNAYVTCSRCDYSTYQELNPLGHRVIEGGSVQADPVSIQNDGAVPFEVVDGVYYSANHEHRSSSEFTVTALYDCTVTLIYGVSSENNYDKLFILNNGSQLNMISGTVSELDLTVTLAAGDVLTVRYTKDGSVSNGEDRGWAKLEYDLIWIDDYVDVPAEILEPDCVNGVICDYCDAVVKNALGHDYETVTVDAACTVDGSATDTCSVCGDTKFQIITATGHSYADGICSACGAVDPNYTPSVVVPTLTLKAPTLEFKDMITVNAMFTAENIEDVVEMGMITYTEQVAEWNVETANHVIPGTTYDVNTGRYIAASQGIHAKYLGDAVYLAVYAKLSDGTYAYSKLAAYSPVQYATSKLKGTDTTLKQLVVSMLNYGAAAQNHFGHNIENLANGTLTAEQLALPESYRPDMVNTVPATSDEKQGVFANNKGFAKRYPSISFEGAFCINYFFTPAYTPVDGITLYYWNEADYESEETLTIENASGSLKLEGEGKAEHRGDITGIAAKSLSEAVYVAAVYSDGTTEWTSGVLGYSIGAYCASQSTKGGTIADLAMATAVYGYHAKAYFG